MKVHPRPKILLLFLLTALFVPPVTAQQLPAELRVLIAEGIARDHGIKINALRVEEAATDAEKARSVLLPRVSLSGNYTRLNDDIRFDDDTESLLLGTQKLLIKEAAGIPFNAGFPEQMGVQPVPSIQDKNILKTAADLEWVIFSGFQASNAVQASEQQQASLRYAGDAEARQLALRIINTYDQLALVLASRRVLTTTEEYLGQQEEYVSKALAAGLATPLERNKVTLARHQLAARQLEYDQKTSLLIESLHQLTGRDREALRALRPTLTDPAGPAPQTTRKRPEILALEAAERASYYKAKLERNGLIPKVAVKGHYELLQQDLSLLDPRWYVAIGFKWNLFDGHQSRLESEKSQLQARQYRERQLEAQEQIDLSLLKYRLDYEAGQQQGELLDREVALSEDNLRMVKMKYENDLSPLQEVLNAIRELEEVRFRKQQALFDTRRAYLDLLHAGGNLSY